MRYSVSNLCYRLLEGPVSVAPLRVLASQTVIWQERRVTFYVLGASHAVRVESEEAQVTELLTCMPPGGSGAVLIETAVETGASLCRRVQDLCCRVRLDPVALTSAASGDDEGDTRERLCVYYPELPDGNTPFTEIRWRLHPDYLEIATLHTYPEERRAVRSATVFERVFKTQRQRS